MKFNQNSNNINITDNELSIIKKYIQFKLSQGLPELNGEPVRLDLLLDILSTDVICEYKNLENYVEKLNHSNCN